MRRPPERESGKEAARDVQVIEGRFGLLADFATEVKYGTPRTTRAPRPSRRWRALRGSDALRSSGPLHFRKDRPINLCSLAIAACVAWDLDRCPNAIDQLTHVRTEPEVLIVSSNYEGFHIVMATHAHDPTGLTRDMLNTGSIEKIMMKDAPTLHLSSEAARLLSLREMLATRPAGDVWVFAYGSLIWNPAMRIVEERRAQINGWHRAFCLSMSGGRGTADNPGLVLGLEAGGSCSGTAIRLLEKDVHTELALLWRREMLCVGYIPRWVPVQNENGAKFGWAIAFTIDTASAQYAGTLTRETVVKRLATASGGLGSSSDYLFRTQDGLRAHNIRDGYIEQLAEDVNKEIDRRRGHHADQPRRRTMTRQLELDVA